jgi:hypothetical protein
MLEVKTVADLTEEHRGWQISITDDRLLSGHRQAELDGINLKNENTVPPATRSR